MRDVNVPASFRIGLGMIKRYFNGVAKDKIKKDFDEVATNVAKNGKIKEVQDFIKYAKKEILNENLDEAIYNVPTVIQYLEDVEKSGKIDKKVIRQCIAVLSKI